MDSSAWAMIFSICFSRARACARSSGPSEARRDSVAAANRGNIKIARFWARIGIPLEFRYGPDGAIAAYLQGILRPMERQRAVGGPLRSGGEFFAKLPRSFAGFRVYY